MGQYVGKYLSGRYVLQKVIAVGEKSIVYKAYDNLEDRIVAVKIFSGEVYIKEGMSRQLKKELNELSLLSFTGIVQIYDYEFDGPQKYIAMEYVDGLSLRDYLKKQEILNWRDALNIAEEVLLALEYAHQRGIAHQNIKPENVLLANDGTVKVTDFKLSGLMDTKTKVITGSYHDYVTYFSPEQARGDAASKKTDIYAVGALLFKMLTGSVPYGVKSMVSAMQSWGNPRRKSKVKDVIPAGLKEIVFRAIHRDPERRYQSISDMLGDIKMLELDPGITFNYDYGEKTAKKREIDWEKWASKLRAAPVVIGVLVPVIMAVLIAVILMSLGKNFLFSSRIKVPNLIGRDYKSVRADPKYKNIDIKMITTEYNDTYPAGTIISQDPQPETTVDKGSAVKVFVSLGPEKITVPDVTGMKEVDAVSALNNAGFKNVKTSKVYDSVTEAGLAVRVKPSVNSQVSADVAIIVYVSMGAESKNKLVTVPNLSGMSYNEANRKLKALGLKAGTKTYRTSGAAANTVISQEPAADSRVAAGTRVNLVLSSRKKTAAGSSTSSTAAAGDGINKPANNFKWQINWTQGFLPAR